MAQTPTVAPSMLEWKKPGVIEPSEGREISMKLTFDEEATQKIYQPRSGTPPPPPSAREQKRPKKQTSPKKDKNAHTSAGSGEEFCREQ